MAIAAEYREVLSLLMDQNVAVGSPEASFKSITRVLSNINSQQSEKLIEVKDEL
jgi:hypothetical protein